MSRRQASQRGRFNRVIVEEEEEEEEEVVEQEEEEEEVDDSSDEDNRKRKRSRSSQSQQQIRKPIAPTSSQSSSSQAATREEIQSLSNEEIENIVNDFVRYILYSDRKKVPILKSEITKNVLSRFSKEKRLVQNVFQRGMNKLTTVFGYELKELPKKSKEAVQSYILLNNRDISRTTAALDKIIEAARSEGGGNITGENREERISNQNLSFITIILGIILIEGGGSIDQDSLFQFLNVLDFRQDEKHEIYGEWEKLLEKFSKELYLTRTKTTLTENNKASWLYSYGPRAFAETSKRSILTLISKLYGCEPDSILLKQIQMEEEKLGITSHPQEQQLRGRGRQSQDDEEGGEEEEQSQSQRSQRGRRQPVVEEEEEEEEEEEQPQARRGVRRPTTTTTTTTTTSSQRSRRY